MGQMEDTFPRWLLRNYQKYGSRKIAMQKKDFGIWRKYTWENVYTNVKQVCYGLLSIGLRAGDRVAIIGDNDPQWLFADFATKTLGGIVVGLFTDAIPSELEYIIGNSDSKIVFAKDQEQVDKMLDIKDKVGIERVIYWDPKGMLKYDASCLMSFSHILELGKKYETEHVGLFEELIERGKEEDICLLCYTSGTKSLPKGALLSSSPCFRICRKWLEFHPWQDNYQLISYMPLAWMGGQGIDLPAWLLSGATINFPEKPETVFIDSREIGARALVYSPRQWDYFSSEVLAKMTDADIFKRLMYRLALPVGYKRLELAEGKDKVSLLWRFLYGLANAAVFNPLKDKLGFSKVTFALMGGAPVSPDSFRFFQAIGLPMVQGYGSTETGTPLCIHRLWDVVFDTVGQPVTEVELRISDEGEIVVRHPYLFKGYHKDAKKTQESIRAGWYHTGDAGYITSEGHALVMDRIDYLMEISGGEKFSPSYIESRLKFSPYIRDATVVGGKELPFVSAMIAIDYANMGHWAEKNGLPYTTFLDLSQKPEVYDLIQKEIERVNSRLPQGARVKKFSNLHKELDPDEAELTRTWKLRRGSVEEKFKGIIDAIYGNEAVCTIESEVRYQDGRKGTITATVKVRTISTL